MAHIINRDDTACETVSNYDEARAAAIERGWLMLDLGWCPVCRYCILGGDENNLRDRYEYPPRSQAGVTR